MTASELQHGPVRLLANGFYTRYWLVWRHDGAGTIYMAVQIIQTTDDGTYEVAECADLESQYGFRKVEYTKGHPLYLIERTNADGTPFQSMFR